jgi:prolyl 4-hydroxylase
MKKASEGIWITTSLLSLDECTSIIEAAEANRFNVAHMYEEFGRHNHETFLESSDAAERLMSRLDTDVSQESSINFRVKAIGKSLECYRYDKGEFIAPHTDAAVEIQPNIWSEFTLVLYLNEDFEGGETAFPSLGLKIRPRRGEAVLFMQSLPHEGAIVIRGRKYILRTGVATSGSQRR